MTREEAKEQLKQEAELNDIRKAYAEGAEIQFKSLFNGWIDLDDPDFSQSADKYRIKPASHYMTPIEVMCFCDNLARLPTYSLILVKLKGEKIMYNWIIVNSNSVIENYEYAFLDDKGKQVSDWNEFIK